MRAVRKWAALLLAALLCMGLSGCDFLPSEEFNDYDVSSYIQALLDSSYHDDHRALVGVFQTAEDSARVNYSTTVENAAINFCNAYGINCSEEQMQRLRDIMAKALLGTRYRVDDEVKTETGYTIDVTVTPVTSFSGLTEQFTAIRSQAQEEENRRSMVDLDEDDEDDGGEDWEDGGEEEPTPQPQSAAELYVDRALDLCESRLSSLEFGGEDVTIVMDIRLTENGELQLDLNQIDEIDRAVLAFQ